MTQVYQTHWTNLTIEQIIFRVENDFIGFVCSKNGDYFGLSDSAIRDHLSIVNGYAVLRTNVTKRFFLLDLQVKITLLRGQIFHFSQKFLNDLLRPKFSTEDTLAQSWTYIFQLESGEWVSIYDRKIHLLNHSPLCDEIISKEISEYRLK